MDVRPRRHRLRHGIDNELLSDNCVLCNTGVSHPAEVIRLKDLLDETGWGGPTHVPPAALDPCRTVYNWSDSTEAEHVGDVLFVLGEGDEDKARQLLADRERETR